MLDREIRRAIRSEQHFGVMMLDLEHFKTFNDTYGDEAGDAVLRETASFLIRSVRAEDFVCRDGGEEFVAVLPTADLRAAEARSQRIRAEIPGSRGDAPGAIPWSNHGVDRSCCTTRSWNE
jgi:diguanylate cyclase (GGDEF)-like protein